jgi:RNA polymerase nonessential primary-like sigma factor
VAEEERVMWDNSVKYETDEIFRIINQYQELPAEEQIRLARLAQAGNKEARDMLILTNLRLVVAKVKPWMTAQNASDVIQEGVIGLWKAIDKYNPKSGYNFSTYAVYWIQQTARRWASRQHVLYIPINVHDEVIKVQMCLKDGITDPQEIAERTEMSMKHVNLALSFACLTYASLDRKISETREKSAPFGYYIPDEQNHIEDLEERIDLAQWMNVLNERQRLVIELRFGFGEEEPLTFPAIAKILGVKQQRVVQLYNRAIEKLQKAAGVTPKEVA